MVGLDTVGKLLKLKRIELGLTLEKVANKVGVTANYISLIERGKNTPNADILDKLADLY
ncbi:helix-turn-helix domain-containing protein [Heyndrickxia ginsengihumi]|uniref:helix-turn-helix domain-containing protein n=1 Tax=Heyndrickxia ginsengihumi TaxID=363870 RepID=UPI003D1D3147